MRNRLLEHAVQRLAPACLFIMLSVGASASPAPDVDVFYGGESVGIDGERAAGAWRYADLFSGARIRDFRLDWPQASGVWDVALRGRNILQLDQGYDLELARPGCVSLRASWQETPHRFGDGGRLLHAFNRDAYTLDSSFRQMLENAAIDPLAPVPLATLMPQVLASSGRETGTGLARKQGRVGVEGRVSPGVSVGIAAGAERRDGTRAVATGTYLRRQAVSGEAETGAGYFDRERFVPRGLELPEPVRYRVSDYGLSASLRRTRGYVDAGWQTSRFRNGQGALRWDNPFEGGASVASSADRGRFATGAMDLYPDNDHDRIHVGAGLNLPRRTRVSANVAVATTRQDDPFMAFTTNEALLFPGADRVLGTADDVAGTSAALLPAASLGGEVRTTRIDLRLVSRPLPSLAFRASIKSYEYDNRTQELFFPGYAAFGESYWRAGVGRRIAGRDTLYNEAPGYERRTLAAGVGYVVSPQIRLDADFTKTTHDYDLRQVDKTVEDALRVGLRAEPRDWVSCRLSYLTSTRDYEGPYAIGLETSRLRMFDVWTRDRGRLEAGLDLAPGDRWSLDLAFSDGKDEYPGLVAAPSPLPTTGNVFESYPYGLSETSATCVSAGVGYRFDRVALSAAYGHDTSLWTSLAVTKTTLADDAVQFDPDNRWSRQQDDTNDWVTLAATADVTPGRTTALADLTWSHYRGSLRTANPATPDLNSAVAYDFPEFEQDLLSARLGFRHAIGDDIDLVANYWFEPFRLDDWQSDVMQPYMQGVVQETAGNATTFRSEDVSRYLFLDSRYSDYTINAASLMLAMRF